MAILSADYSNLNYEDMAMEIGLKSKHIPLLIESFLEESVSILDTLEDAISANDYGKIKSSAHAIKGSAGNLRFNEVYEMAKEMELSASSADTSFDYLLYLDAIKKAIATVTK